MGDPHKAEVSYLDNEEISNLDDAKVRGPNDREVDDFTILTAQHMREGFMIKNSKTVDIIMWKYAP